MSGCQSVDESSNLSGRTNLKEISWQALKDRNVQSAANTRSLTGIRKRSLRIAVVMLKALLMTIEELENCKHPETKVTYCCGDWYNECLICGQYVD
jgi:hypothetical protein